MKDSNAVAVSEPQEVSMFERLARDKTVDVAKLKELMDLRDRERAWSAETAFNQAMNAAQTRIGRIAADRENTQTKSKYATYPALDRVLRPIYIDCGFSLSFDTGETPIPDHVRVICFVSHSGGHTRKYHADIPADGKGAKGGDVMTKTHAFGSATQYGMRYLLKMIFNVAIGKDADDDGNGAGTPVVTQDQAATLEALIQEVGANKALFLKWAKVQTLDDIPAKSYATCVDMLRAKGKANG